MIVAAYFTIFLSGCMFTLSVQAILAMWRNPTPPDGCHVVIRKGKRFVRRNPKPKQLVEVPNE